MSNLHSAISESLYVSQTQQSFVRSNKCEIEYLGGGRQEAVGGIGMGQRQLIGGEHDLMGERRLPKVRRRPPHPLGWNLLEFDSSLRVEEQYLPRAHRRKPQFVLCLDELTAHTTPEAGRFDQAPVPDVSVE